MTGAIEATDRAALCNSTTHLILASGSRARADMLRAAGLRFDTVKPAVDEEEVKHSLRAAKAPGSVIAETLAELKAQRVSLRHGASYVIGADQVLECDGKHFDKPASRADALGQLQELRGKSHDLISAAVVVKDGLRLWHHTDRATLSLRPCSDEFLARYLDAMGDRVMTTVGGYEIEGLGAQLFSSTRGDHFTILGLPLLPLLGFLRDAGVAPA
ncbi:MAG TPA: nucleoside triphosphate pyrophosphatase [Verrucomicrobiae bacterium]|nr:nucleoside triphosphate pyrophosphatase [Verrucomicrobiae bacterium]